MFSAVLLALLLALPAAAQAQESFVRGDVNADGSLNVSDAIQILRSLFAGEAAALTCEAAADANGDDDLQLSDAVYLLAFIFQSGEPPPAPYPFCNVNRPDSALSCAEFAPCTTPIYGIPVIADTVIFVVDRAGAMQNSGELSIAKQEMIRFIENREGDFEFGVAFYDAGLHQFPSEDAPATSMPENRAAAISFIEAMPGGGGTCPQRGFSTAFKFASNAAGERIAIVHIGPGSGHCQGNTEFAHLTAR